MIQDHASTIFTGNHIFVVVIEAENEMIHPFQAEKVAKVNVCIEVVHKNPVILAMG